MYMIIDKHVQMLLIVLQSETRMKINTQKHYLIFGSLCYEVQPAWMLYNKYMTASKWEILCRWVGGTNVASFRGLRAAVSVLRHWSEWIVRCVWASLCELYILYSLIMVTVCFVILETLDAECCWKHYEHV